MERTKVVGANGVNGCQEHVTQEHTTLSLTATDERLAVMLQGH